MDKRHFISITVLVSALAFNPLAATEVYLDVIHNGTQQQTNTLTNTIASYLYKRGLDEDAALEISRSFVDENHDDLKDMINNLVHTYRDIDHKDVFEYLSMSALHREKIDLSQYDHLISMVSQIKGSALSAEELVQIQTVSKLNKIYV